MKFKLILLIIIASSSLYSQNWVTTGGNNQKNGVSKITGPTTVNQYWQVTSANSSLWGNSIFTWGDKFVTSRVTFSPSYRAKVEMRNLATGAFIWEKQITDSSVMYAVGFNEDAVYVNDYHYGKLYALNISDGSVKWFINSSMFGGNTGICFATNGDVITFGKRLNKLTGAVMWTNNYPIPVGPDESYCVYGNTYYHWTGFINTPKKLIAIDLTTGLTRYTSADLPGDGDQENDIIISPTGVIYITRDGGSLYAFTDNGTGFQQQWVNSSAPFVKGFAKDGTIYAQSSTGKLIRINPLTGIALDSTTNTYGAQLYSRIATAADSTAYINTGEVGSARYAALSPNLQTERWLFNTTYNYYSCPNLGKEGVMVMIGAGTTITAYKTALTNLKPVADFYARSVSHNCNVTYVNQPVNFFEQSSYVPASWSWQFPGSNTSTSTLQNPVGIIYNTVGVYPVTLAATSSFGTDTLTRSGYLVVIDPLGISNNGGEIPKSFSLSQNYPNPFNPVTTIKFSVPILSNIKINLYDQTGKLVMNLIDKKIHSGNYSYDLNASNLSSGVYFYRMTGDDFRESKKMVVVK